MMMMREGASDNIDTLRLVKNQQDKKTQSEIACAALETRNLSQKNKTTTFIWKVLKGK